MKASSGFSSDLLTPGWCASSDDSSPKVIITFVAPKIVERIRLEKVGNGSAFPTQIRLKSANESGAPLNMYHLGSAFIGGNISDGGILMSKIATANSEILVLDPPLEASVLEIEVIEFQERACLKLEFFGCQKSNCVGMSIRIRLKFFEMIYFLLLHVNASKFRYTCGLIFY